MFKKGISVFLSLTVLLLCLCSVPVFASEPEFDINDYTIGDLDTMTTAEKKELLANFIETYNPYGMQDLLEQEAQENAGGVSAEPEIELLWKSDSDLLEEGQQIATHQLITLEALNVFISDNGFYQTDGTTALIIALNLATASALPDKEEKDNYLFYGHFYDPDTGENYRGDTSPTAKTRAQTHYDNAIAALNEENTPSNPNLLGDEFTDAILDLGRALHYLQDVCEPHHAANKIAGISTHSAFEAHIENNIDTLMPDVTTVSAGFYTNGTGMTVESITHLAATLGKLYIDETTILNKPSWGKVGTECLSNAIWHSGRLLYKFFYDTNATFI